MGKVLAIIAAALVALIVWRVCLYASPPRTRAEREHGIKLPVSARNIQCTGDAPRGFAYSGSAALFEMSSDELTTFLSQLTIRSSANPAKKAGDPTVNGSNVWPQNAPTFVPSNGEYDGFTRTWQGTPVPLKMHSCASPIGSSLHVEVWDLGSTTLIKLFTSLN